MGISISLSTKITSGGVVRLSPPDIPAQSLSFGRDTLQDHGGITITNNGGTIANVSITTDDPTNANHWSLSQSGEFTVSATGAGSLANSYSIGITATNGAGSDTEKTITINTIANSWSVADIDELVAVGEHANLAYGDEILLRNGSYNSTQEDKRIKRTTAAPTGSFTSPSTANSTHPDKGVDLDTGNFVHVKPHTGATPTISRLAVDNVNGYTTGFRFSDLTFTYPPLTTVSSPTNGAIRFINGDSTSWNCAVDNCTIISQTDAGEAFNAQVYSGISVNQGGNNLWFYNNTITDVFNGISGGNDNIEYIGNTIRRAWNDCSKFGPGSNIKFNWNLLIDKKHTDDIFEAHADFMQYLGSSQTSNTDNIRVIGNQLARGSGTSGEGDGQGIFIDDTPSPHWLTNVVIAGNIYHGTSVRGLSITRAKDPIVRNNTVIRDKDQQPLDGLTQIFLRDNDGGTLRNNLARSWNDSEDGNAGTPDTANNVVADDDATVGVTAFINLFDDPQSGSSVTDPKTHFAIKASSVPDTFDPKAGAHQDYVDFSNQQTSFPWEGFTPTAVDTQGNTYITSTSSDPAHDAQGTWWFRYTPNKVSGTQMLYRAAGRTEIQMSAAKLKITVKDSINATVYEATSTNDIFTQDQECTIYVAVDLTTPSIIIEVDGVAPEMTITTAIATGNGLIAHSRDQAFFSQNAGGSILDAEISQVFFDPTQVIAASEFASGSSAENLSSVGSPWLYMGDTQSASDWNSGTNLGSGPDMTVTGTFIPI